MPLQPGFKIVKQSSIEAAKEQIKQLKREKAELKAQLEAKDEEKNSELMFVNKAADEAIAHGKNKIAQQDVIIAELHESSDNARRAFVELQFKYDETTMPLYAQRVEDDEIDEAIAKVLKDVDGGDSDGSTVE